MRDGRYLLRVHARKVSVFPDHHDRVFDWEKLGEVHATRGDNSQTSSSNVQGTLFEGRLAMSNLHSYIFPKRPFKQVLQTFGKRDLTVTAPQLRLSVYLEGEGQGQTQPVPVGTAYVNVMDLLKRGQ